MYAMYKNVIESEFVEKGAVDHANLMHPVNLGNHVDHANQEDPVNHPSQIYLTIHANHVIHAGKTGLIYSRHIYHQEESTATKNRDSSNITTEINRRRFWNTDLIIHLFLIFNLTFISAI